MHRVFQQRSLDMKKMMMAMEKLIRKQQAETTSLRIETAKHDAQLNDLTLQRGAMQTKINTLEEVQTADTYIWK